MKGFVAMLVVVTMAILLTAAVVVVAKDVVPGGTFKQFDNSWCFKGVYDYDNCPGM